MAITGVLGKLRLEQHVDDLNAPQFAERSSQAMKVLFCPTRAGRFSGDVKSEKVFGHGGCALYEPSRDAAGRVPRGGSGDGKLIEHDE